MIEYICLGCGRQDGFHVSDVFPWPRDMKGWCSITGKREEMQPIVPDYAIPQLGDSDD